MTVKSFDEHNIVALTDPPASQGSANQSWAQPFVASQGADRAVYMLVSGAISSNDIVLALYQAKDSSGTDAKVITGATATIPNNTSGEIVTVEIGPGALDNTVDEDGASLFTWVQSRVTSGASQLWGLIYIRHNLRYPGLHEQDATYVAQVRVYD